MAGKVEDIVRYYEWDGLAEKWIISEDVFDSDFPSTLYSDDQSVATWIVTDVFGLSLVSDPNIGSSLPGYDIKNRNAYDMIRLSLAGELLYNKLYECYANEEGSIEFYQVGNSDADIDVLYKIEGSELSRKCDTVIVMGYNPPPKRYAGSEFDLFTYANYIDYSQLPNFDRRYVNDIYPKYYVWGDIFGPEQCDYFKEGYIVYGNPYFDNKNILINQGVYNPKNFESINNFIYKINIPFFEPGHTTVNFSNTSPRIEELNSFGELQHRTLVKDKTYMPAVCREGDEPDPTKGVILPNSNDVRFLGVRAVYIYGYKIKHMSLNKYKVGDKRIDGPADVVISIDTKLAEPFALSAGTDYIVTKDPQNTDYYRIVFSNAIENEEIGKLFGGEINIGNGGSGGIKTIISWQSIVNSTDLMSYANPKASIDPQNEVAVGVLRDGKTEARSDEVERVTIFPTGDGTTGYGVKQLLVVYDWDEPCVHIKDTRNVVTIDNLEKVKISFYPMITKDSPAPVATHEMILDPSEAIPDEDIITEEELHSVTYNRVFSSLESGDIKLTLPFLDNAEDCLLVASYVKSLQDIVAPSVTYVCSPKSSPKLGDVVDGDLVINSITYSYQDSNSYFNSGWAYLARYG